MHATTHIFRILSIRQRWIDFIAFTLLLQFVLCSSIVVVCACVRVSYTKNEMTDRMSGVCVAHSFLFLFQIVHSCVCVFADGHSVPETYMPAHTCTHSSARTHIYATYEGQHHFSPRKHLAFDTHARYLQFRVCIFTMATSDRN